MDAKNTAKVALQCRVSKSKNKLRIDCRQMIVYDLPRRSMIA